MKKILPVLLVIILAFSIFAGCAAPAAEESAEPTPSPPQLSESAPVAEKDRFTLATLKGPTTMGLVKLLEESDAGELDYTVENTIYGTADEITALIVGGKVDMAAVPCNLASVLYNKTNGAVQVIAINTLGVLNVLELGDSINSIEDLRGKTIYSTGKGTTPEFALNAILRANGINPETDVTIEFKSESTEIAALLAGENAEPGTIAVLPQPYATTVLMQNSEARIALNLTEEWEKSGLDGNLITGVFIARRSFTEIKPDLISAFISDYTHSAGWVNDNVAEAAVLVADLEIVPQAAVAEKALPYCSIVAISGSSMKTDISAYLEVLFEQDPASVGGALPGDDFYFNA